MPQPELSVPTGRHLALRGGEELPLTRDAAKLDCADGLEGDVRARREVAHSPGQHDLAGARRREHARGDVHTDPTEVVAANLNLAGVDGGPDLDPEAASRGAQRQGAPDRAGRRLEAGEDAVAGGLDELSAPPLDLGPCRLVVPVERASPLAVAHRRRAAR